MSVISQYALLIFGVALMVVAAIGFALEVIRRNFPGLTPPVTQRELTPLAFLRQIRIDRPNVISAYAVGPLTGDSTPVAFSYEVSKPDMRVRIMHHSLDGAPENVRADFARLALSVRWGGYCDAECGWCGWCGNVPHDRGYLNNPADLLT